MGEKSLNKVCLLGRLGKDPETRYVQSGKAVTTFSMATASSWKDQSGETQERTEWHRIVAWGKLAEICDGYLKKGSQAYVEGRLQTREWEDQDGNKRSTTEIVASELILLGGSKQGEGSKPKPRSNEPPPPDDGFDDIPF